MAIWLLSHPLGPRPKGARRAEPTAPARIAEHLGVSRPAAGEMLTKLESRGLVERGSRKEALLTAEGRAAAMQVVRRHRLIERFLTDTLQYQPWEVHEHVGALPDAFEPAALERLYEQLGQPERCPHGFPIDPDHELRENPTLTTLGKLSGAGEFVLVRVAEPARDLHQRLAAGGVTIGSSFQRTPCECADGLCTFSISGEGIAGVTCLEIGECESLLVRDASVPEVPARARCWADILRSERHLATS